LANDLSGLAVHFAQRLCGRAEGGEVLVSAAAREGCAGSSIGFALAQRCVFSMSEFEEVP
jgi:class 3 adenylate cyclase